jgi:ketosteroid isomerase-like protein/DNA-directed RNA polymerase subunit RPC12/RpoP
MKLIAFALRLTGVALSIWAALSMLSLLVGTVGPSMWGRSPDLAGYAFALFVGIVLMVIPYEIAGSIMRAGSRGDWSETAELLRPGITLLGLIILCRGTSDAVVRAYRLAEYNSSQAYPLTMDWFWASKSAAEAFALLLACLFIFKARTVTRLIRCASRIIDERAGGGYGEASPTVLSRRFAVSPGGTGTTDIRSETEDINERHPSEGRSQMPDATVRAVFEQMKDQTLLATAAFFVGEYPPEGQALLKEAAASRGFDDSRIREYRESCYPNAELRFRCDKCGSELLADREIFVEGEYTCPDCGANEFISYEELKLATPLRFPGSLIRRLSGRRPPPRDAILDGSFWPGLKADVSLGSCIHMREKTVFERFCSLWSGGDAGDLEEIVAEDIVYESVAEGKILRGIDEVRSMLTIDLGKANDTKIELVRFVREGEVAAAEIIATGSDAETHRTPTMRGSAVLEFEEGRISKATVYWSPRIEPDVPAPPE